MRWANTLGPDKPREPSRHMRRRERTEQRPCGSTHTCLFTELCDITAKHAVSLLPSPPLCPARPQHDFHSFRFLSLSCSSSQTTEESEFHPATVGGDIAQAMVFFTKALLLLRLNSIFDRTTASSLMSTTTLSRCSRFYSLL